MKNKFKKIGVFFKNLLINYVDILETFIWLFLFKLGNNWLFLIIACWWGFVSIRRHYRVFKSKMILKNKLINERVQGNEGFQGQGKTSLMLYMASLEYKANEIYTIVPCKIKGQYTNVLTKEILQLKEQIPLHTCILGDELTMFFNNLTNKKELSDDLVASTACLYQSIRHFTDGNIINTSVDMTRLNKQLEEKHSVFNKLLGQDTHKSSWVIIPIYKMILRIIGKYDKTKHQYLGTYRTWEYQTFVPITHENYYYDLSTDTSNLKENHYSNLTTIWAYNNLDYEYNDTYLRKLYKTLPVNVPIKWKDMEIDREMLNKIGYSQLVKYFPTFRE